jgi:hypothetical protein
MTGLNKEDNVMSLRLMAKRNLFLLATSKLKMSQTSDSRLYNAHSLYNSKNRAHRRRNDYKGDLDGTSTHEYIASRDAVYHVRKWEQEYHCPLPQQKHHLLKA